MRHGPAGTGKERGDHAEHQHGLGEHLHPFKADAADLGDVVDEAGAAQRIGLKLDVDIREVRKAVRGEHPLDDNRPMAEVVVAREFGAQEQRGHHDAAHGEKQRAGGDEREGAVPPADRADAQRTAQQADEGGRLGQQIQNAGGKHQRADGGEDERQREIHVEPAARGLHKAVKREDEQQQTDKLFRIVKHAVFLLWRSGNSA